MIEPPKPTSNGGNGAQMVIELEDISFEEIQKIKDGEVRALVFAPHGRGHFQFKKIRMETKIKDSDTAIIEHGFMYNPVPMVLNESGKVITPLSVKYKGGVITMAFKNPITGTIYLS